MSATLPGKRVLVGAIASAHGVRGEVKIKSFTGKPADVADAARMLRRLSGRTHSVATVVWLLHADGEASATSRSEVTFATLDDATLDAYLATGEWQGKAGGYAIQGRAAAFIAHLSGSYSGVMGLPLFETAALLRGHGVTI